MEKSFTPVFNISDSASLDTLALKTNITLFIGSVNAAVSTTSLLDTSPTPYFLIGIPAAFASKASASNEPIASALIVIP